MYAVVVRERGQADQINTSGQHVQANVLPRARQAPGIVSGFWMTDMAGATLNVMVFESEDVARSALEPVRTAPRPPSMQGKVPTSMRYWPTSKASIRIEHGPRRPV
jgi:hypothetical protein